MKIRVIGVPSAWGTKELGARRTPGVLRDAGLLDWLASSGLQVEDSGDVPIPEQTEENLWELSAAQAQSSPAGGAEPLVHVDEVAAMARAVRCAVADALEDGDLPFVVGGECCLSIGVVPALAERHGAVTVAWLDAHGDINTPESSESGLITGMPLAVVLGHGHPELLSVGDGRTSDEAPGASGEGGSPPRPRAEDTWLLSGRDLDSGETANIAAWSVRHAATDEVREAGAEEVTLGILGLPESAILPPEARALADAGADDGTGEGSPNVYLHFDVDSLDPEFAPGVHYRVDGGFYPSEVSDIAGYLCTSGHVGAISVASANLDHDRDGRTVESVRSVVTSIADALAQAGYPLIP